VIVIFIRVIMTKIIIIIIIIIIVVVVVGRWGAGVCVLTVLHFVTTRTRPSTDSRIFSWKMSKLQARHPHQNTTCPLYMRGLHGTSSEPLERLSPRPW
jgi:flagellar basal body-associated protein FliL